LPIRLLSDRTILVQLTGGRKGSTANCRSKMRMSYLGKVEMSY
jgi:hypothetical protein